MTTPRRRTRGSPPDDSSLPNPQHLTIAHSYAAAGDGKYVKVTLSQGTFEFDTKNLNDNHTTHYKATCSGIFTGTGPAPVLDGTGLYAGITGTIEVTQTHVLVASRYTTGKHKGQCDKVGNHIHHYDSIAATGNVSFQ